MSQRSDSVAYLQREVGPLSSIDADALCDALEDLPEALRLATCLLRYRKVSARDYLGSFLTRQAELFAGWSVPTQYPILIAASMCADSLNPKNALLTIMASLMGQRDIPFALVGDWKASELIPVYMPEHRAKLASILSSLPPTLTNADNLKEALADMEQVGLIEIAADSFSFIHPLAQEALHRILPKKELQSFVHLLLIRLTSLEHFDIKNEESWPNVMRLAPHLEALVDYLESMRLYNRRAGELLLVMSGYYLLKGNNQRAKELSLRAIPHIKGDTEQTGEVFIDTYELQGSLFYKKGDLESAKELFDGALSLSPRPLTVKAANLLRHLAEILFHEDKPKEAKALFQEALSLAEQDLSVAPGVAFACAATLGRILQEGDDNEEAETLITRALKFPRDEEFLGSYFLALGVLAKSRLILRKYSEAREVLNTTAIVLEPYGEVVAPLLGMVFGNLAEVLYHLDELPEAHEKAMQAIEMLEGTPHEDAPAFASILLFSGRILAKQGEHEAARQMLTRALEQEEEELTEEIQEALAKLPV
jgi:tetratricopeptide (TPR) repeat protein